MAIVIVAIPSGETTACLPTGTYGQMSLGRLVEQLAKAGEFQPGEVVTHLVFDFDQGMMRFRTERGDDRGRV